LTALLIADPDAGARRRTAAALRLAGYTVESTGVFERTASLLRRRRPSALILDPDGAGPVETVSTLRAQTDIPILVISATSGEWDKVAMLDAGADDYLTKPFGVEELLARLRAVFRRTTPTPTDQEPITTSDFTIHLADRRWVQSDGTEIHLTPIEWRFIEMLVSHPGHLVTQADLLQGVWGPKAVEKSHYLRVQIAGIRRKVEPEPGRPRYFITAPGLGLRFEPHPAGDTEDLPASAAVAGGAVGAEAH
jgi:two-component system KDP operon response regulator KdpE